MIKVLLYPRNFKVDCDQCNEGFKNMFNHYIYDCSHLRNQRQNLINMLNFYDFPKHCILNKVKFLSTCLENKAWTKCITDFLEVVNY